MNEPFTLFTNRYIRGIGHAQATDRDLGFIAQSDNLFGQYASAAHMVPYVLEGAASGEAAPRLTKDLLDDHEEYEDRAVECSWLLLDVDFKDVEWTAEGADAWRQYVEDLAATDPVLGRWRAWHTTEHGWHLIYHLDRPVSPSRYELVAEGMRQAFAERGIECDRACSDWTRMFALPRIVKENGVETVRAHWYRDSYLPSSSLPLDLAPVAALRSTRTRRAINSPMTTDASDALLLAFEDGDHQKPTKAGKVLLRALQSEGDPELTALMNAEPFEEGGRDTTVARIAGKLCNIGVRLARHGVSRELVFGVMVPSCWATDTDSGPQDSGDSWADKAEGRINVFWDATLEELNKLAEAYDEQVTETLGDLTRTELARRAGMTEDQMERSLILTSSHRSGYYVVTEDGSYIDGLTSLDQCLGWLERSGIAALYGLVSLDGTTGEIKTISERALKRKHNGLARVIKSSAAYEGQKGRARALGVDLGGVVEMDQATVRIHKVPSRYSLRVSTMLDVMFGPYPDDYRRLKYWLSHYPDFQDSQLPALVITGRTRTGKSLLGNALSHFSTTCRPKVMHGAFDSFLSEGALLFYDDRDLFSGASFEAIREATGTLRNVVMGQSIFANPKYGKQAHVQIPWRVIVAQNGHDYQDALSRACYGPRNLDHRLAVLKRTFAVDIHPRAAEWLLENAPRNDEGEGQEAFEKEIASHVQWMCDTYDADDFQDLEAEREKGGFRAIPQPHLLDEALQDEGTSLDSTIEAKLLDQVLNILTPSRAVEPGMILTPEGEILTTSARLRRALDYGFLPPQMKSEVRELLKGITRPRRREDGNRYSAGSAASVVTWTGGSYNVQEIERVHRWMTVDLDALQVLASQQTEDKIAAFEQVSSLIFKIKAYGLPQ